MNYIFDTGDRRKLALYDNTNIISMCVMTHEYSGHPVILSGDYRSNLTACTLDNKLYYAYISTDNHVKVKSIDDIRTKWEFNETSDNIFLVTYNQNLLLFYTKTADSKNNLDNPENTSEITTCNIHCHVLSGDIQMGNTAMLMNLYETVNLPKPYADYCIKAQIDRRVNDATLQIKKDYLFSITSDLEEKYAEKHKLFKEGLNTQLTELESQLKSQHEQQLIEQETQLKSQHEQQLAEREATLKKKYDKKIKELNTTIDSIKLQYNQLMDTARRYKEDAAKWHDLYVQRH